MTMKFLPDVSIYDEAKNEKKRLDILKSRKTRFLEMQLLGVTTSRNCAGLSVLTSEMNPFRKSGYFTKCRKKNKYEIHKMRTRSRDFVKYSR